MDDISGNDNSTPKKVSDKLKAKNKFKAKQMCNELQRRKLERSKKLMAEHSPKCDAPEEHKQRIQSYQRIIEELRNRPKVESSVDTWTREDTNRVIDALKRAVKK